MQDHFTLAQQLSDYGQAHLLREVADLSPAVRERFLERLSGINWDELRDTVEQKKYGTVSSSKILTQGQLAQREGALRARGEAAYKAGEVAVLMVAGGQGTRLGFDGPKGCFQVAPHSGKSIYQLHAEKVLALSQRIGQQVPFLVMTSPATDEETRDFFQAHGYFSLAPEQVWFFCQGMVPSLDLDGRALCAGPGQLLENPDGHGGCFTALVQSGTLQRLIDLNIRHLLYIQVDNILAVVDDPLVIGLACEENADVITKVVEKHDPDEKVGHLVSVDGHDQMVEYTELNSEQVRERTASGDLLYRWGNTAMHYWRVGFFQELHESGFTLPLHRSRKPLQAWVDGALVQLTGWKSERFIFDLLPRARVSLGLAVNRSTEFAPVKQATGNDSPMTAVQLASDLYANWLRAAGVTVALPTDARIEISPIYAATKEQFLARWDKRAARVTGDFYLEA